MLSEILGIFRSNHTFAQGLNYLRYKFGKKDERLNYAPVTLSIVATSRCTLACDMCPTHSRFVPKDYPYVQKNIKDIDFAMFKDIIDRFPLALTVQIIGSGEPLLNKDFFKMVDYASGKKMVVKTFSNGTTIDDNIDKILGSKLSGITISLNGHNMEEFTRMTGIDGRVFEDICRATKKLIEERDKRRSKVRVKISHIIDKHNYKIISEMVRFSLRLGADHVFLCNFLPCPYEGLTADSRVLEFEEGIMKEIKGMISSFPARALKKVTWPFLVNRNAKTVSCDSHFSQIRFDGDGNVSSCSMMLLNMTDQGFHRDEGVWNNEFFRTMRRKFLSGKDALPEPCLICPDNFGVYPWR